MEICDVLKRAQQEVIGAGIDEDLRPVAYRAALELILREASVDSRASGISVAPVDQPAIPLEMIPMTISRIADRLELPLEAIEAVFGDEDAEFSLIFSPGRLSSSMLEGTQEIALLTACASECAEGTGSWTGIELIRRWCIEYKKYNAPNFSRAINGMELEFVFRGKAKGREVRLSRPGWQKVRELICRMTGTSVP